MAHSSSRLRNLSVFADSAFGPQAEISNMFKSQFGSALLRLFCLLAFALSFSGIAHAQAPPRTTLTLTYLGPKLEGATQDFQVTLNAPATQRLTFAFDTTPGSGFGFDSPTGARELPSGPFQADYNFFRRDFTFEVGASSVNISVPTIQDNTYEFDETFTGSIFSPRYNGQPANNVTISVDTATAVIVNDDAPPIVTLIQPEPILEGDSNNRQVQNYNFTVNLSEISERPISLAFTTTDGTATSQGTAPGETDFSRRSSDPVQVPAGTKQFQYTVLVFGDDVYEDNETFTLRVEYSPQLAGTASSTVTGTILENDLPSYNIDASEATAEEGLPLAFTFNLVDRQGREAFARNNIVFKYSIQDITTTGPGALPPASPDYSDPQGGTFTIPKGLSRFRLVIPTIDDNIIEQTETFRLIITDAPGTLAPVGIGSTSIGTILDTGDRNGGNVFTIQDARVLEGTGPTANTRLRFTVNLTKASTNPSSVVYRTLPVTDGDPLARATPGVDFTSIPPTTLNFAPNQTQAFFEVPIAADAINELDESFLVELSNPTNGQFDNNAPTITRRGTIIDDDPAGVVSVTNADIDVAENVVGGIVNIPVTLVPTGPQLRPVTVDFDTLPGTAQQTGNRDYFGKSGTLTFPPGTTQLNIPIELVNDNVREGDETFTVRLSNPNGATLGLQTATQVTIKDDEAVPLVRISPTEGRYIEGDSTQKFTLFLLTPSQADVSVAYTFVDGTATNNSDYVGISGTATFTAGGPQSIPVSFNINDDNVAEGDENFSVQLAPKTPANEIPNFNFEKGINAANFTIVDNDRTPDFKIGDARVVEGNPVTPPVTTPPTPPVITELVFPITLSRPSSRPVTFTYSTLNVAQADCTPAKGCDKTSDADYAVARNVAVTIPAGSTTSEIRIRVVQDTLNEFNEQVAIVTRNLTNAVPLVYTDPVNASQRFGTTAFGTIVNDDAGGVITLGPATNPATGAAITTGIAEGYNRGGAQRVGEAANFLVSLPAPAGRPITVNYRIAGAANSADVQDLTTGPGRGSITFFNGDTKRNISLRAISDNLVEGTERMDVILSIVDNNGPNSFTTTAVSSTSIFDRTPRVNTVAPTIGFSSYGTIAATRVTIAGEQLRTEGNPRVDAVLFNNVPVGRGGIQYLTDNSIAVSVPENAKTGPLRLRLVDGTLVSNIGLSATVPVQPLPDFVVQPVIQSFTPITGVVGASTVAITGRNFQDPNNAVTGVQFVGATANIGAGATVVSDTRINVVVPAGATTGPLRIVSVKGGAGPASQVAFSVVGATAGSIRLGDNPDRNAILEGSTGTINQPVRNFNGTGDTTFHRPYQFFINPATQNTGANVGAALPQTPLTVRFQVTSNGTGGRIPQIGVRVDLVNAGRPTFENGRSTNGIIDVALDERFNPANPITVAIVDAGTDNLPPIIGGISPNVTVTATIIASANTTFFPIGSQTSIQVDRIEPIDGTNQTAIAFGPNSKANFSVPYSDTNSNSISIAEAFRNVAPSATTYTIYRFNAAGQSNKLNDVNGTPGADFTALPANGRLERGVGYRLVVADKATVQLKTKDVGVTTGVTTFSYNLTRNTVMSATGSNQANATNGYNFIGFPFNPAQFQNVDFREGRVIVDGVERSVTDAASAGLINAKLFVLNDQGNLVEANTTLLKPFQAYFVQVFRDNVTLRLQNPTR